MTTPITLQSLFNLGWQHFVLDNKPLSIGLRGDCAYLSPTGERCVIGLGLPEKVAKAATEARLTARELVREYPDLFDSSVDEAVWAKAQWELHDVLVGRLPTKTISREGNYRAFARDYKLTIPGESK